MHTNWHRELLGLLYPYLCRFEIRNIALHTLENTIRDIRIDDERERERERIAMCTMYMHACVCISTILGSIFGTSSPCLYARWFCSNWLYFLLFSVWYCRCRTRCYSCWCELLPLLMCRGLLLSMFPIMFRPFSLLIRFCFFVVVVVCFHFIFQSIYK